LKSVGFLLPSRRIWATRSASRIRGNRADGEAGGKASVPARWRLLSPTMETLIAVYMVRFENAVSVLHAFQKKSPSGIRTAKRDVDLVEHRLKHAQRDYEDHYGKTTR
jgi:hypothetical protein